ncbi:MAG: CDP-diacylglycerol--glycerol-3-phosphate 3-phosphatidyltransferase [Alphaproteobacteria bacterium]
MLTGLPNILTLSRIFVIPLLVGAFYLPAPISNWTAFGLFVVASATDYFDGYLARRLGQISPFGRFLDPVADKLLVAAAIVMLIWADRAPLIPALIILCREILVSGLREFLAELKVGLPVTQLAKWKTGSQMVAICLLLIGNAPPVNDILGMSLTDFGGILLWVAAALTAVTGYDYLRVGLKHIVFTESDGETGE